MWTFWKRCSLPTTLSSFNEWNIVLDLAILEFITENASGLENELLQLSLRVQECIVRSGINILLVSSNRAE